MAKQKEAIPNLFLWAEGEEVRENHHIQEAFLEKVAFTRLSKSGLGLTAQTWMLEGFREPDTLNE